MPRTFSPPPRVSDPDMHHGTCMTHVSWCMLGSLTSGFLCSRRRGKRSRHSRRMRNPPFYVSGKRPFGYGYTLDLNAVYSALRPWRTPSKDRICTCMYSKYWQNKAMVPSSIYNDDLYSCKTLPLHWSAPSPLYVRDNHAVLSIYCYTHWEFKLVGQKDDSVKIGKSKFDYRVSAEKHSVLLDFQCVSVGMHCWNIKNNMRALVTSILLGPITHIRCLACMEIPLCESRRH